MKSFIVPLAAACGACLCAVEIAGQSAPTMNQEPRHQRLTYIRNMRVFQLALAPGESTSDYMHDYDAVSVALTDGTIRTRRAGSEETPRARTQGSAEVADFTGAPATQRIENAGTSPYRAVVVENLRDRGWTTPTPLAAPATSLQRESRSFAVYDMRLNTATRSTNHVHQNPSFVVLISGVVQVQGGGGESEFRLEQNGRWFPSSGPEQPHSITLAAGSEAHVICVEAK